MKTITAIRDEYIDYHAITQLTNTKIIPTAPYTNEELHNHYEHCVDYLLLYWDKHWNKQWSTQEIFLDSNLRYRPKKQKGRKIPTKSIQRLTHKHDVRPALGKYYSHMQVINMLKDKAQHTLKSDKFKLQDWTVGVVHRFNAYVEWIKEWDAKYCPTMVPDSGLHYKELDDLKLKINWIK